MSSLQHQKDYEEDVLKNSVTSEEGIIKLLKKDAVHTSDSSGQGFSEKGIIKSFEEDTTHAGTSSEHKLDMLNRVKPGRVDEVLDEKHSHLNQASPGHCIDVSDRAELGHVDNQSRSINVSDWAKHGHIDDHSHSIDVSEKVEPGYVDEQSHLDLGQPRPSHVKDTLSVDHSHSDQVSSGHEVGTSSVTTSHSVNEV